MVIGAPEKTETASGEGSLDYSLRIEAPNYLRGDESNHPTYIISANQGGLTLSEEGTDRSVVMHSMDEDDILRMSCLLQTRTYLASRFCRDFSGGDDYLTIDFILEETKTRPLFSALTPIELGRFRLEYLEKDAA